MATLSNILAAASITNVGSGGTGAVSLTGLIKGNGSSPFTAASSVTDYVAPSTAVLTGTPQAVTAANATSNSMIATTQFVLNNIPVPVASGISTGKAIAMSMIFGF